MTKPEPRQAMEFAVTAIVEFIYENVEEESFEEAQRVYFPKFEALLTDEGKALLSETIESFKAQATLRMAGAGL